jgi:hypothetical protein
MGSMEDLPMIHSWLSAIHNLLSQYSRTVMKDRVPHAQGVFLGAIRAGHSAPFFVKFLDRFRAHPWCRKRRRSGGLPAKEELNLIHKLSGRERGVNLPCQ